MSHESRTTDEKLVYMANQIATFFKSQPEADRPVGIATHINKFWETRMRRAFFAIVDTGGTGLDPLVIEASVLIKRPNAGSEGVGTGTQAAAGAPDGKGTAAGEQKSESSIPQ